MNRTWMPAVLGGAMLLISGGGVAAAESSAAFLQEVAQIDMAEVVDGQLAQQKSDNPAVKDYGHMLEADHDKHLTRVKELAGSMGVSLPAEPKPEDKAEATKLDGLSGSAFDQEFITHMIEGHKKAIALFQDAAKSGMPETSSLAQQTLPALQQHLQTAEAISAQLGQAPAN